MISVIICVKLVVRHYDDVPAAHTNVDIIVKEEGSEQTVRETTDENGYIYKEFTRPSHITVSINYRVESQMPILQSLYVSLASQIF